MFKIKNIKIKNKLSLAPMLNFTNLPFRLLCKKYGCSLLYTEMVHSNLINHYSDISEIPSLQSTFKDEVTSVQIVGDFTNKNTIKAIHKLDDYKFFKIIDLNFGCPAPKIHQSNSGAILLNQLKKAEDVLKEVCETCRKPITIKTRLGYNKDIILKQYDFFTKFNISALAIHARTSKQSYAYEPSLENILKIINYKTLPIFYNGNVNLDTLHTLKHYDFDSFMVGRFALGNPFAFKQLNSILNNKEKDLSHKQIIKILKNYFSLCKKYNLSFKNIKVSIIPFIHTMPYSKEIKQKVICSKTLNQLENIIVNL